MNRGQFSAQLNEIQAILKRVDLYRDRNYVPEYQRVSAAEFRHLDYFEVWQKSFRENYYDFQLIDDALLSFRVDNFEPLNISYSYYECPYEMAMSFDEYLQKQIGFSAEDISNYDVNPLDESDFYDSQPLKYSITPIRYDYSPQLYTSGRHPASHIHFGFNTHIRVGTKKILQPKAFLFFVIRQFYPDNWVTHCTQMEEGMIRRTVRDSLGNIEDAHFGGLDLCEMYLN